MVVEMLGQYKRIYEEEYMGRYVSRKGNLSEIVNQSNTTINNTTIFNLNNNKKTYLNSSSMPSS